MKLNPPKSKLVLALARQVRFSKRSSTLFCLPPIFRSICRKVFQARSFLYVFCLFIFILFQVANGYPFAFVVESITQKQSWILDSSMLAERLLWKLSLQKEIDIISNNKALEISNNQHHYFVNRDNCKSKDGVLVNIY